MVHAFRVKRLDAAAAECDPLRDEEAGAGFVVEVRETGGGNVDRKVGQAGQRCEADFGFQLVPATVAKRVGEVAGEFHEKVGVQARVRMRILNRQQELLTRVAAGKWLAAGNSDDAVVWGKRSETPESFGQECLATEAQRCPMRWKGESGGIAPLEIHNAQSGCSVTP